MGTLTIHLILAASLGYILEMASFEAILLLHAVVWTIGLHITDTFYTETEGKIHLVKQVQLKYMNVTCNHV